MYADAGRAAARRSLGALPGASRSDQTVTRTGTATVEVAQAPAAPGRASPLRDPTSIRGRRAWIRTHSRDRADRRLCAGHRTPSRHGLDGVFGTGRARQAAALSRLDFHCRLLASPLRVAVPARDHG